VKVYRLNENGHWDDKGTGNVSCEYMEVRTIPGR
jgi:protein phosphatase-4 regulatory subunit 3